MHHALNFLVPTVNYQFYELQCAGFPLAQCPKLISGTTCLFVRDKYLRNIPADVSPMTNKLCIHIFQVLMSV